MNADAVSNVELRRAAWRHQRHYLSGSRMKELLPPQLDRVRDQREALAGDDATVSRYEPALLRHVDEVLNHAAWALDVEAYGQATDDVLAARRACARIQALVDADGAIGRAEEAVERARALVDLPRLLRLPSFTAPARLLEVARERMSAGRYVQAGYLAQACVLQAGPLAAREQPVPAARAAALTAALGEIESLCRATRALVAHPAADLDADGTLDTLRARATEGHAALAERLAAELLLTLAARQQFRRELERGTGLGPPGAVPAEVREALLGATDDGAWARATLLLRRIRQERMSAAMPRGTGFTLPNAPPAPRTAESPSAPDPSGG